MVPAADSFGHEPDRDALVEHRLHHRAQLLGVGPGVSLPDTDSDLEQGLGILDDLCPCPPWRPLATCRTFSPSSISTVTSRVPAQIDRLLRLGFGLEPDFAVDHRRTTSRSGEAFRSRSTLASRCRAALFDEARNLRLGHHDLTALLSLPWSRRTPTARRISRPYCVTITEPLVQRIGSGEKVRRPARARSSSHPIDGPGDRDRGNDSAVPIAHRRRDAGDARLSVRPHSVPSRAGEPRVSTRSPNDRIGEHARWVCGSAHARRTLAPEPAVIGIRAPTRTVSRRPAAVPWTRRRCAVCLPGR